MRALIASALILLLAACAATGSNVVSNADPGTDFTQIRTFGFFQPLGTDRPGGIRTPLTNMVGSAVVRELTAMGWQESDNPDVLINFFVNVQQRMEVRQVPTSSSFHSYRRGRYRPWGGYETRVREVNQGTMSIDIIDPRRQMLVWDGTMEARLGRGNVEITQEQVNTAVAAILADLPR